RLQFVGRHLGDDVLDFAIDVLEPVVEPFLPREVARDDLDDRERVAVEIDRSAGGSRDRPHGHPPKLASADACWACTSRKLCAPVICSIVSTRFCTPVSLSDPPAAWACRERSMRQPIAALAT